VRENFTLACWGYNSAGQTTPPDDPFKQVSAGAYHSCGLRVDGTLACWGEDYLYFGIIIPPAGTFKEVRAGWMHTCAIRTNGTMACWGYGLTGAQWPLGGFFQQVGAGSGHSCALQLDSTPICWGYAGPVIYPPGGTFARLSVGSYHNCGVKTDGTVACWGGNSYGQLNVPSGTFTQVSTGTNHTCAVRVNNELKCWGADNDGGAGNWWFTVPPAPAWVLDGTLPEGAHIGLDFEDDNDDNDLMCTDVEELGPNLALGGGRQPRNPWDFADVPSPALPGGARNGAVALTDVGAALIWVGATDGGVPNPNGRDYDDDSNANGVDDGAEYDRTPNGEISGPPNGAVSLSDVGVILAQVGDSCIAAPN
jgi:hypothetical protein